MSVSPVLSHVLIVSAPSCLNRSLQENIQFGFSVGCVVQNTVIMAYLEFIIINAAYDLWWLFFVGTMMILCPWHEHTLTGQELLLIYNTSSLLCFCDGHLPRVGQAALPSNDFCTLPVSAQIQTQPFSSHIHMQPLINSPPKILTSGYPTL